MCWGGEEEGRFDLADNLGPHRIPNPLAGVLRPDGVALDLADNIGSHRVPPN